MGRNVEENHKIVEQTDYGAADLIKQQNIAGEFVLGECEEETPEADTRKGDAEDSAELAEKEESQQKEEQQEGDKIDTADQEESLQELLGNSELVEKEEIQQKKEFEGTVVLTGAATYLDSGIRYFKNKPTKVTDQRTYEQLLRTRLFVRV